MLATPVYCAVMTIMAREALAEMKAKFSELWSALWPIMAATALMALTVLLLREFVLAGRSDPPLLRLLFLSAGGAIAYGAALFAIGTPVIAEGAEVLGWILRYQTNRDHEKHQAILRVCSIIMLPYSIVMCYSSRQFCGPICGQTDGEREINGTEGSESPNPRHVWGRPRPVAAGHR